MKVSEEDQKRTNFSAVLMLISLFLAAVAIGVTLFSHFQAQTETSLTMVQIDKRTKPKLTPTPLIKERTTFADVLETIDQQGFALGQNDIPPCVSHKDDGRMFPIEPELFSNEGQPQQSYQDAYVYDLFYRYPCPEIIVEEIFGSPKNP